MKLVATFLLLLVTVAGAAERAAPRVTGIYSNLRYVEDSGDLIGWEILVTPAGAKGYSAVVQLAEGGAPMVMVGTLVVDGAKIVLTIPAGQVLSGKYSGTISATELKLTTPDGPETLKRGKSYWQ